MVGVRRGNDRVGSARPPPLASVHSPHPPLRVVSPWDGLSQIREGEEEEETSAQGLGGPQMVRWLQKSTQEDMFPGLLQSSSSRRPSSGCTVWLPPWTPEAHVTGLIWGVCVITVSGGLSSCMWLRGGPCPSLQWLKGWTRISDSDRSVPAELGLDTQASSCLRKGTPLASLIV